jgi:hypothetical protein
MVAEAPQERPYGVQVCGGVRVEVPDQGLVGGFVLALRGRFARQPADRHGTLLTRGMFPQPRFVLAVAD